MSGAAGPTVLLDAADTKRRLVQQFLPLAGLFVGFVGVSLAVRPADRVAGLALVAVGLALIVLVSRVLVRFDVPYKGHAIRFENSPVFGESLTIDGVKTSGGVLGYRKTIRAAIRDGDGAGERIAATSEAGLLAFRCRIVAEPPGAGPDGVSSAGAW